MINLNLKSSVNTLKLLLVGTIILLLVPTASSQERMVKGRVVDEDSETLPAVNVYIKGTTKGTTSNMDGIFQLPVKQGQTVEASFIGYKTASVIYVGQEYMEFILQEDVVGLDEVVVIGYGVQKKSDLSGSVASVKADKLLDIPAMDVASTLKGKAAGVVVTSTTGMPGSAPSIRIRGASSIDASNEPLYIIDGIGGNINNINQNDIQSIEILKDAASTAIYGAAGANGVILVTTKQGSEGEMKVNFSMKVGMQSKVNPIDLLTSQQEYELLKDLNSNTPGFVDDYFYDGKDQSKASTHIDTTNWENVNWQDEIMQEATFQEYNLSLMGGSKKTKFLVSSVYKKNEGIIKTASAEQIIFRVNLNNQLTENLNILTNVNISHHNQNPVADNSEGWNGALINSAFTYPNFVPIYDPNNPDKFMINPLRPQFDNPQAWIRGEKQGAKNTGINGLFQLQWEIINGLNFISRNSVSYSSSNADQWLNPYDTYNGRNAEGQYTISFSEGLSMGTQNTLTYLKDIGKHSFSGMAGVIFGKGQSARNSVTGLGFPNDLIKEINAATTISGSSGHGEDFSAAYIGRLNYSYASKYLAQFNIRADGSAFFGKNYRWATFPSASVAWKISDEDFFKDNITAINFLKLRASYGLSGNKPSQNFMYMATYSPQGSDYGDGAYPIDLSNSLTSGYSIARGENNDLRWETTKELNIGLDMHMFKNRIIFNMDLYTRDAFDLLYILEPPITYFDYGSGSNGGLLMNIANTSNKGIELSVSTKNTTGALKWNTDVVFAYNKNEVLSLGENPIVNFDQRQVINPGYVLNAFWGYEVDRLFQEDDFDPATGKLKDDVPSQPNVKPGDIKFKNNYSGDESETGAVVNKDDKVYLGNPVPPITYSMTNTLTYGNFDFSIFLQGIQGSKIWNRTRESTESMDNNLHQFATVLNRWTPSNTDTEMPRAVLGDPAQNNRLSDRYVEDGSYLRLKDIVLGYCLPSQFINRIKIDNMRIYFSAQNLYTITNYSGYDPEVRAVDFSGYPQNKTFILGLNLTF
jgi:TonB-linked SusC/RagA family outer membrane protein